jgi:hypothetical protein
MEGTKALDLKQVVLAGPTIEAPAPSHALFPEDELPTAFGQRETRLIQVLRLASRHHSTFRWHKSW